MSSRNLEIFFSLAIFAFSLSIYTSTLDSTFSLWDCGEFIASAYKLQITHPPGSPLYMLLGRLFSLFAPSPQYVAYTVNMLSAVSSALTVMFLYKILRLLFKKQQYSERSARIASLAGAILFATTDSFWFSAVEAEVYALSLFFSTLIFWLMLRWEAASDTETSPDRYLYLIALLTGLSVGVHLLNLLVLPALVYIWFQKKNQNLRRYYRVKIFIYSILVLFYAQFILLKGSVWFVGRIELLFVNKLNLPYHSGLLFSIVFTLITITLGLYLSYKKKKQTLHNLILCTALFLLGFSMYFTILIRSDANPPMNENNPNTIFALETYLNRDQYGSSPLFYGTYFDAEFATNLHGERKQTWNYKYIKTDSKYLKIKKKIPKYEYENGMTIFPRMQSQSESHIEAYKLWGGIKDTISPNFGNNLQYFASYQLGQMYFRYLLWNFAGRQNDIHGQGHFERGNFITGFDFADQILIGHPHETQKNTTSRNVYYLIPFVLGIIGLVIQHKKARNDFWVVFMFFIFNGVAIVVYLNQEPYQARERDYAYVGSFMAFAIWIAYAILHFTEYLFKKTSKIIGIYLVHFIAFSLPVYMLVENYADHDRSNRHIVRDIARNFLAPLPPDAILFVNADNDTFPLWYLQDVEGFRTDVRIINLSLLNADWYINALRFKAYRSLPVKFQLPPEAYTESRNELTEIIENPTITKQFAYQISATGHLTAKDALGFLHSKADSSKIITVNDTISYLPSKKMQIDFYDTTLAWDIPDNYLIKSELALLDILASNAAERPIYFSDVIESNEMIGLKRYTQREGLNFRLVGLIQDSTELLTTQYDILSSKFTLKQTDLQQNINYDIKRYIKMIQLFDIYSETLNGLILCKEAEKAKTIANLTVAVFPHQTFTYDDRFIVLVSAYTLANEHDKAYTIAKRIAENLHKELAYIEAQEPPFSYYLAARKIQITDFLKLKK